MAGASTGDGRGIHAINITPMVDIILVLLVVFMVTSTAISASQSVEVDKPEAATGKASNEPSATFTVTCDVEGRLYLDSTEPQTEGEIARRARAALADNPKTQAIIRCDKAAQVDTMVRVIDLLRGAGITKYAIATTVPDTKAR